MLIDGLPEIQRLALAYAPARSRERWLGLLALDQRLAGIVRSSREPSLAQLRLAWWREQLRAPVADWPQGDPLLAVLQGWQDRRGVLAALCDGWEEMVGASPLAAHAFDALAQARAGCCAALADAPESAENAVRYGRNWALADIAAHLSNPAERETVLGLARASDWGRGKLSRQLRPLAVLHGLARRNLAKNRPAQHVSPGGMICALRIGLLGV